MGREKAHLHTRGEYVATTIPPWTFHLRGEVQSNFLRGVSESYTPRDVRLSRQCAIAPPNSSRCLRFYQSCPRNGQFNVQTPGAQERAFSLRHRAIIVRAPAIHFHRPVIRGEGSEGYLSMISRPRLEEHLVLHS